MNPELSLALQIRWRDIDRLGHINQSVYYELMEEARVALFTQLIGKREFGEGLWVVVHTELDNLAEVRRDHEEVRVSARLARVGTTSITMEQEIIRPDGVVAASGSVVLVAWDGVARTKRAFNDAEKAAFKDV